MPRRILEDTRRLVCHAIENGMHPADASELYDVGRSTVYKWWAEFQEKGAAAFEVKPAPGRPPRLSDNQLAQLRAWIVGKDPRQMQFDFALWTRQMVRELIQLKFGVEYTLPAVGNILHGFGLSPQRPLVRAYEQDPAAAARWRQKQYPAIAARAKAQGASIFFCDESGIRTDYHSGTTWAPVGRTPVVRGTGSRKSLNMISAVSPQGKLHFSFAEGNVNSARFIEYCEKLMHDIPGKIFLIVDGHPSHTSKATREFAAKTDGRLTLFYLPSYSPELNPDEWVWKNIKHDNIGRMAVRAVEEMRNGIMEVVSRLQASAEVVKGFFLDPDLRYITESIQ